MAGASMAKHEALKQRSPPVMMALSKRRIELAPVKSASSSHLRIDPALREAAEAVLREGETLTGFVEQSMRVAIALRQRNAFVAGGLASRDRTGRSGRHVAAEDVIASLQDRLNKVRRT